MSENKIDFILCPNTFEETPKTIEELIGKNEAEKHEQKTPISEYKMDYFTAVANCLGVPALTVPIYENS